MDYKAGEKLKLAAWQKPTSRGYNLLSLSEDNWSKKKKMEEREDKEVTPTYNTVKHKKFGGDGFDDDVPF